MTSSVQSGNYLNIKCEPGGPGPREIKGSERLNQIVAESITRRISEWVDFFNYKFGISYCITVIHTLSYEKILLQNKWALTLINTPSRYKRGISYNKIKHVIDGNFCGIRARALGGKFEDVKR